MNESIFEKNDGEAIRKIEPKFYIHASAVDVLTRQHHALAETFLKSAVLASISLGFSNFTISGSDTGIDSFILHSPLEKSLASVSERVEKERKEC